MGYGVHRFVFSLFCAAILFLPAACGSSPPAPAPGPAPCSGAAVKSEDWRARIGETVEMDGYLLLDEDGTGLLVQDLDDVSQNQVSSGTA